MMGDRLKRGDAVRVRLSGVDDEWTLALVALASDSQPSSVMLMLGGAVRDGHGGFIAKALPLSVDYGKETVTSLFGGSYEIEVAS